MRQFDLRLPSSAYPSPRGGLRRFHARSGSHDDSNVPPALISYKRHHLDLNTISCSATQPHYIALGGAHLHCFLHDRRYLGRDRLAERGDPGNLSSPDNMSLSENELMGQATRCVRRFAPNGRSRMRRIDNGHITACKISDSNPNLLIASWSGDHIYSFDLIRSPDAYTSKENSTHDAQYENISSKIKESRDRKRKRKQTTASASSERHGRGVNPRLNQDRTNEPEDLALRVRYENGQSEDISMPDPVDVISGAVLESARESILTESQRRSLRIAQSVVRIRKMLFSLDAAIRTSDGDRSHDPLVHGSIFTSVLDSATILSEMNEISRSWRYPVDPLEEEIVVQQTLRTHRDSARRFVQAAGNLAKVLSGEAPTAENGSNLFQIGPLLHEGPKTPQDQIFSLEFLKAILLWLDGGPKALLEGFQRPPNYRMGDLRFPIPDAADYSAIDRHLVPYLLRLARGSIRAIPNVDTSRFETDERRHIFDSETGAVNAFSKVVRTSIEDLPPSNLPPVQDKPSIIQDKMAAIRFWGFRVARGVLMNAGIGINFQYVDIAFGGIGTSRVDEGRIQDEIDTHENEEIVESASLVKRDENPSYTSVTSPETLDQDEQTSTAVSNPASRESSVDFEDAGSDAEMILMDDLHDEIAEHVAEHDDSMEEDGEDYGEEDDENIAEDSDGDITAEERHFIFRSAADRGKFRELVDADVPYTSHTRKYQGHCNVKVRDPSTFADCLI